MSKLDDLMLETTAPGGGDALQILPDFSKLAHRPSEPVHMSYRVRNLLSHNVAGTLELKVADGDGKTVLIRFSS